MFFSFSFLTAKPLSPPKFVILIHIFSQIPFSSVPLETQAVVLSKVEVVTTESWVLDGSPSHFIGATSVCGRAAGPNSRWIGSWGGEFLFSSLKPLKNKTGMSKLLLLNFLYLLTVWPQKKT